MIPKVQANLYHQINITLEFKFRPNADAVKVVAYRIMTNLKERLEFRKTSNDEYDTFVEEVASDIKIIVVLEN
jgi:ribosomal protein S3